jgi:hypothetical protein
VVGNPGPNVGHTQLESKWDERVSQTCHLFFISSYKETLENTEGAIKNGNPEKLATYGTQDDENQCKKTLMSY